MRLDDSERLIDFISGLVQVLSAVMKEGNVFVFVNCVSVVSKQAWHFVFHFSGESRLLLLFTISRIMKEFSILTSGKISYEYS